MKQPQELRRNPVTVLLSDQELQELEAACAPEGKSAFVRQAVRRHIALVSRRARGQATFAQNCIAEHERGLRGGFTGRS